VKRRAARSTILLGCGADRILAAAGAPTPRSTSGEASSQKGPEMRGALNHRVTQFKSLAVALKELEPFIRNGEHLHTGRPFRRFGDMRSREALANWLLCVTINAADKRNLTFTSDPLGGDGLIRDPVTGEAWPTEHVMARATPGASADLNELVLAAIAKKRDKGTAYAAGKTLVVLVEGGGVWYANRIARKLPQPLHFAAVWAVGLNGVEDGRYSYWVAMLDCGDGDAPVYRVTIADDFASWAVTGVQ
jgi:hypothetical protein